MMKVVGATLLGSAVATLTSLVGLALPQVVAGGLAWAFPSLTGVFQGLSMAAMAYVAATSLPLLAWMAFIAIAGLACDLTA
jgi:hypothetical protein